MAQLYNSSIIGSGKDYNMFDAVERGQQIAEKQTARQNQVNYDEALKTYGPAAYAGDKHAQDMLAQFDPAGMRTIRNQDTSAATAETERVARLKLEQDKHALDLRKEYNDQLAKLSETEQKAAKAEAEKIAKGALGITDEATWNAYVVQNGGTPEEYPFAMKDQLIYSILPPDVVQEFVKGKGPAVDPYGLPSTGAPQPNMLTPPVTPPPSGVKTDLGTTTPGVTAPPVVNAPPPTPEAKVTTTGKFAEKNRLGTKAETGYGWTVVDGQEVQVPMPGSDKDNTGVIQNKVEQGVVLIGTIDQLLNTPDDELDNVLGTVGGGPKGAGAPGLANTLGGWADWANGPQAQANVTKINQLKGQAFLLAAELMKANSGTAAGMSEAESAAATAAVARLDRAQSPADFKRALNELRETLSRGVEVGKSTVNTRNKAYGRQWQAPEIPASPLNSRQPAVMDNTSSPASPWLLPNADRASKAARLEELRRKAQGY